MFTERPLRSLGRTEASALIHSLYSPEQRFGRAFYRYWVEVAGQSPEQALISTASELAESARALADRLDDPHVFALVTEGQCGAEAIGLFALRPLSEHPFGQRIAVLIGKNPLTGFPAPYGIAHSVAVRDDHAGLSALQAILASIARKSIARGYGTVFFYSSDRRLARLYARFGMTFPPELAAVGTGHLVGVYEPTRPDNMRRLRDYDRRQRAELASAP
jgi:hypothetical protein